MKLSSPLVEGTLIRRYKRFLADVELPGGEVITVHCPNSGSMKTCATPGWKAVISDSGNPARKLRYTLEFVHSGRGWIGVNTQSPNRLAEESVREGRIPELLGYAEVRREVKYGEGSRIDLLLENPGDPRKCYVEVKNVSLLSEDGNYEFPDAVTSRGLKHLHELEKMAAEGHRAVMLFVVQRNDGRIFRPAWSIDPEYSLALQRGILRGIEVLCYGVLIEPPELRLGGAIEVNLEGP